MDNDVEALDERDILVAIDEADATTDETSPAESSPATSPEDTPTEVEADPDPAPKPAADEDRKTFGKRAEARIRGLVGKNKDLEQALASVVEERDKFAQVAKTATTRARTSEDQTVEAYKQRIDSQLSSAEAQWKRSEEQGDRDGMFAATEQLAEAKANKVQLDNWEQTRVAKQEAAKAKRQAAPAPAATAQPEPRELDGRAQEWVRKNSWFKEDPEMYDMAQVIDRQLQREGYKPDDLDDAEFGSEGYYSEIDKRIRGYFPTKFDKPKSAEKPTVQQVTAGVSRTSARSKSPTQVRLTPSEVDIATRTGVPLKEYARQKAKLEAQGGQ